MGWVKLLLGLMTSMPLTLTGLTLTKANNDKGDGHN